MKLTLRYNISHEIGKCLKETTLKNTILLVTLTVMAFTSNMIFANSSAKDLALKNSCISTNPELGDSAYWAVTAIEQFAEKKFSNAIETVDTCFHQWGHEAGQKQKVMNRKNKVCPPIGKVSSRKKRNIDKNYLMNDVSMALWAKARSQHELGQLDAAIKTYGQCVYMACGRAWDPKGWFWSPALDCAEQVRELID